MEFLRKHLYLVAVATAALIFGCDNGREGDVGNGPGHSPTTRRIGEDATCDLSLDDALGVDELYLIFASDVSSDTYDEFQYTMAHFSQGNWNCYLLERGIVPDVVEQKGASLQILDATRSMKVYEGSIVEFREIELATEEETSQVNVKDLVIGPESNALVLGYSGLVDEAALSYSYSTTDKEGKTIVPTRLVTDGSGGSNTTGRFASLALDSGGLQSVFFLDVVGESVERIRQQNGSWLQETVRSFGSSPEGGVLDALIDEDGDAHLLVSNGSSRIEYWYLKEDSPDISSFNSSEGEGFMSLDEEGTPHIVTRQGTLLRYFTNDASPPAITQPHSGTTAEDDVTGNWYAATLSTAVAPAAGAKFDVAFESDGTPHALVSVNGEDGLRDYVHVWIGAETVEYKELGSIPVVYGNDRIFKELHITVSDR